MSRRGRNSRAWRYVWGGIRRDADARALVLASESDGWGYERLEYSDSDSEADYSAAMVPPVASAVPVTGESYCGCDYQAETIHHRQGFYQVKDCLCGEDDQDFDWVWDAGSRSTATLLSCDNREVNFHSEYSCGTAAIRGCKELAEGQHFWEIKMTSPVYGTDMMVGIGTSDVNLDRYRHSFCSLLGKDVDSWGLSYTGLLHHKGDKMNFSSRFGQGSIIGVHLDTWHGTLTFFKNRKCIGVAATDLQNKRFYPMACSTAAKSSMKVIRSCSAPTSLLYLCCVRLRQLRPDCTDTLDVLPLPPGLRHLLHNKLGWLLNLHGGAADESADIPEPSPRLALPPSAGPSSWESDSEGCASDLEACQRKRCRWT
ncbi:SPRY domain-containing SOCS box protein 3a isoform X2 [Hippocampus zosterae]|uniref:SPRY domain-containing SOCS box protein 3a isoform X2 n=1 Tax=Hippocampus zosterae TaxID=109293 RepID=UPI00223E4138|nr:SPRY domain-containing SOCS box protein 3a isoform X2 [Hippocampus zosterae]XP_051905134.1 SPRY domain-containing SOCS box protein 3a isoform X2 [Hippocampus zosterae]